MFQTKYNNLGLDLRQGHLYVNNKFSGAKKVIYPWGKIIYTFFHSLHMGSNGKLLKAWCHITTPKEVSALIYFRLISKKCAQVFITFYEFAVNYNILNIIIDSQSIRAWTSLKSYSHTLLLWFKYFREILLRSLI